MNSYIFFSNPRVSCKSSALPRLNLDLWREGGSSGSGSSSNRPVSGPFFQPPVRPAASIDSPLPFSQVRTLIVSLIFNLEMLSKKKCVQYVAYYSHCLRNFLMFKLGTENRVKVINRGCTAAI